MSDDFNCLVFGKKCKENIYDYYILVGGEFVKAENCVFHPFKSKSYCTYEGYDYYNPVLSRKYVKTVDYAPDVCLFDTFLICSAFALPYFLMKLIKILASSKIN